MNLHRVKSYLFWILFSFLGFGLGQNIILDDSLVAYADMIKVKIGCFGSGSRSVYVDTDGDVLPCPFCRRKTVNVLSPEMDDVVDQLKKIGCHTFMQSPF